MGCIVRSIVTGVLWFIIMAMLYEKNIPPEYRPWVAFAVLVGSFVFSLMIPIDRTQNKSSVENVTYVSNSKHETWEEKELRSEATYKTYWDQDGNRHRQLNNTKPSGEKVVYDDYIDKYADIPAWGDSKLKK